MVDPTAADAASENRAGPSHPGAPVHLSVPRDAALFAARRPRRGDRGDGIEASGDSGVRPLRRAVGRCAEEAGAAQPVRRALSETRSTFMRWRRITQACRSSSRTSAPGFSAKRCSSPICAPNVYLDTSSTNRWMAYHPSLTLRDVFRQALDVAGPDRLLFGSDSSFFPRGWNRQIYDAQATALAPRGDGRKCYEGAFSAEISNDCFPGPLPERPCRGSRPSLFRTCCRPAVVLSWV